MRWLRRLLQWAEVPEETEHVPGSTRWPVQVAEAMPTITEQCDQADAAWWSGEMESGDTMQSQRRAVLGDGRVVDVTIEVVLWTSEDHALAATLANYGTPRGDA